MDFAQLVRSRRMVRSFEPDRTIPAEQLRMLLRLVVRAPSAGHTQGWRFLVLADITARSRFWNATSSGPADTWRLGMQNASALVVCFSDREAYLDRYAEPDKERSARDLADWPIPYWHVDVGMAAMILLLAANDVGLAACFFGVPAGTWSALSTAFEMPARLSPVGVVALGYPAADERSRPMRRGRRPFDEVVTIIGDDAVGGQAS